MFDSLFDKELFYTHTPIGTFERGKMWRDSEGKRWRMTRTVQIASTALFNGGSAPCWVVYGKRI